MRSEVVSLVFDLGHRNSYPTKQMKQWLRFSIFEFLLASVVLSIGVYLNFKTQGGTNYRRYGWPLTAVEFQIYPRSDDSYGPAFEQLAYRMPEEYWMPIRSVDTPGCIALNCLFFLGLTLLFIVLNRRYIVWRSTSPTHLIDEQHN